MHYFIVNPSAKAGKSKITWDAIKKKLDESQVVFVCYETRKDYTATQIAREITTDIVEPIIIVIVGGDGTINEVINGIENFALVTIAVIPSGSGNDFVRDLPVKKKPLDLIDSILEPKHYMSLDIGILKNEERQIERKFAVSCGVGYDAEVIERIENSNLKEKLNKWHMGKSVYVIEGIKQILANKPFRARIFVDGQKKELSTINFISIHNHKYEGAGFKFAPNANVSDGLFDICIIRSATKLQFVYLLFCSITGKHIHKKGALMLTGKNVTIEAEKNRKNVVHTDGELIGDLVTFQVEYVPQKLRIITG